MTTKSEFVDRVAEQSGIGAREVGLVLSAMVDAIGEAAARDELVEIEGLGQFVVDQAGVLRFTPAPELKRSARPNG